MQIDPKAITVKAFPLVWRDELAAAAKDAGTGLEELQHRLVSIARAELGKLDWQEGELKPVKLGKGAHSARMGSSKSVEIANPHAALVMFREIELVHSLTKEFASVHVTLSKGTANFVATVCEKLGTEEKERQATTVAA